MDDPKLSAGDVQSIAAEARREPAGVCMSSWRRSTAPNRAACSPR